MRIPAPLFVSLAAAVIAGAPPAIAVTTPTGNPSFSNTGPCSMCVSK